jgi:hypothetical protein
LAGKGRGYSRRQRRCRAGLFLYTEPDGGCRIESEAAAIVKRTFFVRALWDEEAKVFYCESDIDGLHIEAADLDTFEDVMFDAAIDLIVANHISLPELAETPLKDLIPAILWERPSVTPVAA